MECQKSILSVRRVISHWQTPRNCGRGVKVRAIVTPPTASQGVATTLIFRLPKDAVLKAFATIINRRVRSRLQMPVFFRR